MEHSRLLKFLLPETKTKMAEPVKIKFDYQSPENVKAEVPGAQKIREPETGNEEVLSNNEETPKNGEYSKDKEENPNETIQDCENITSDVPEVSEDVETRHRHVFSGKRNGIHGEPVILGTLLTKQQTTEDKKPKTKIPISRFRQTVERVKAERREEKKKEGMIEKSHIPVRRSSIPKPVKEPKMPTTVKKEITVTKTLIKNDSAEAVITKNVVRSESKESTNTVEREAQSFSAEDEFDKLFADVVNDPQADINIDETLLSPKVEDPDKLESKFEEIIHDYEENKVEPIDVEVVRRSKLPQLKRRSQQENELSAQAERTSKIIAARDKLRLRHSMNKDENFEKALDEELKKAEMHNDSKESKVDSSLEKEMPKVDTKTETKHEIISSPNSKVETLTQSTKTISTSSTNDVDNNESSSIVQTITVKEETTNETKDRKVDKNHYIAEENIVKDSIRIAYPVFNCQVNKFSESNESTKIVEIRQTMSYTSTSEELSLANKFSEEKVQSNVSETMNEQSFSKKEEQMNVSETTKDMKSEIIDSNSELTSNLNESMKSTSTNFVSSVTHSKTAKEDITTKTIKRDTDIEKVQLRGKVEKLINKIDSKEIIETEGNQRQSINELTKKKSVLSKIAMFERKPEEAIITRGLKNEIKESKLPKLITKDWRKVEHGNEHVHTPLIVDEVFKPFNSDITIKGKDKSEEKPTTKSLNSEVDKDEYSLTDDPEITTIIRAESVALKSSNSVHYTAENRIQIENKSVEEKSVQIVPQQLNPIQTNEETVHLRPKTQMPKLDLRPKEIDIHDIPTSAIKSEQFEFKNNINKPTRLSMTKEIQAPVIIPGFKPVRTILKSFESKNEDDNKYNIQRSLSKEQRNIKKLSETSVSDNKVIKTQTSEIYTYPREKLSETNTLLENKIVKTQISKIDSYSSETYDAFESTKDYKSLDDVFNKEAEFERLKLRQEDDLKRAQSLAELDLGEAFKGKVNSIILRMKSVDRNELERKEAISKKEMPRKRSVSEKIALFEGKVTPSKTEFPTPLRIFKTDKTCEISFQNSEPRSVQKLNTKMIEMTKTEERKRIEIQREKSVTQIIEKKLTEVPNDNDEEEVKKKIEELSNAKNKYGKIEDIPTIELSNGVVMPVLALGTALLEPRLAYHIVSAAIDLGYRAFDTAFIYGNEKYVGDAVRDKIADGTVRREDLFIISKLWSTYHRTDLVEGACRASLDAMGLEYFDLYLIHNPMSFKEGAGPIPKIATVLQYSEYDYLDAWYGMEKLVTKGLARAIGVSNFNSLQLQRVLDKGKIKPVINQVECHPYLSQQRLDIFCSERNVTLSCFGVLGSKGTPLELKNGQPAVIDDALVQVMASGLGITPAQLLISYQLENGHAVVVKASSAHHLHDNLLALGVSLTSGQVDALHALNRNKRMFTYRGMGDTHKNYPFHAAF